MSSVDKPPLPPPPTHRPSHSTNPPAIPCLLLAVLLAVLLALLTESRYHISRLLPSASTTAVPEIHLCGAIRTEGIGAVLSGLKPVLLLANATGAVITMCKDVGSGHGYPLRKFLRIEGPLKRHRIPCNISADQVDNIMRDIVTQCAHLNLTLLQQQGVFRECNLLNVTRYLSHPRKCLPHTASLVRGVTKFELNDNARKEDVCVLRRGGDVEERIMNGEGNVWAIDEQRTIPVLRRVAERGSRVVLVTETSMQSQVTKLYRPDVFSNRERLGEVVKRLEQCRCLFVAGGSSFAAAMVQITEPRFIVYMTNRTGFQFHADPYDFDEYKDRAYPVSTGVQSLTKLCSP